MPSPRPCLLDAEMPMDRLALMDAKAKTGKLQPGQAPAVQVRSDFVHNSLAAMSPPAGTAPPSQGQYSRSLTGWKPPPARRHRREQFAIADTTTRTNHRLMSLQAPASSGGDVLTISAVIQQQYGPKSASRQTRSRGTRHLGLYVGETQNNGVVKANALRTWMWEPTARPAWIGRLPSPTGSARLNVTLAAINTRAMEKPQGYEARH